MGSGSYLSHSAQKLCSAQDLEQDLELATMESVFLKQYNFGPTCHNKWKLDGNNSKIQYPTESRSEVQRVSSLAEENEHTKRLDEMGTGANSIYC